MAMDFNKIANGSKLFSITPALLDSSSDDEIERLSRGGSRPGRATNIDRDPGALGDILYRQYFTADPIYDLGIFHCRFCVSPDIFARLLNALLVSDAYFVRKEDCTALKGLSPYHKMFAAMQMLATGVCSNEIDDKFGLSQTTALIRLQ